jgi:hypothetical protein
VVNGLHKPTWNRTRKPLAIALSEVRRGLRGRDDGGNVTNVQYKSNQNCHYEPPVSWIYPNKNLFLKTHWMRPIKEWNEKGNSMNLKMDQ